ncbi:hypothetical protein SADUNF_Sadunf01G0017900 [Salix dunnii]|uniref:BZIP domain-containing protein n=1 Tax=Salix dunnii TaxID=1413687 RepID=A0A835TJI7_9ROSI|nr:hypothetical protein SADUNF_Sadunf01G0017900 [Salix dunnii]
MFIVLDVVSFFLDIYQFSVLISFSKCYEMLIMERRRIGGKGFCFFFKSHCNLQISSSSRLPSMSAFDELPAARNSSESQVDPRIYCSRVSIIRAVIMQIAMPLLCDKLVVLVCYKLKLFNFALGLLFVWRNEMKDYNMDDGEVELSDHVLLPNPDSSGSLQSSASVDSLLDEFLKSTRTCTHTHTCNPSGPDAIHTHTCYHTHTQVITSEEDDDLNNRENSNSKAKRPAGNREAVRKYREKKKARTAYLEEEVKKLRISNQQLMRKIQQQVILEAEVLRLRSVLVDLRGKIGTELGLFPFQNLGDTIAVFKDGNCGAHVSTGGPMNLQCQTDLPCFHAQVVGSSSQVNNDGNAKLMESWEGNCQPVIANCQATLDNMATTEGHAMDMVEALMSSSPRVQ